MSTNIGSSRAHVQITSLSCDQVGYTSPSPCYPSDVDQNQRLQRLHWLPYVTETAGTQREICIEQVLVIYSFATAVLPKSDVVLASMSHFLRIYIYCASY